MENIIISSVEMKHTAKGVPFASVVDVMGVKYTVWDAGIGTYLSSNIGKAVGVEVKTTPGGFKNIRGYTPVGSTPAVTPAPAPAPAIVPFSHAPAPVSEDGWTKIPSQDIHVETAPVTAPVTAGKHTTMYTSYAKDIFIALVSSNLTTDDLQVDMKTAIDLVRKARDAFA